jgi:Ca2+-binding EF-hand superfamily protein
MNFFGMTYVAGPHNSLAAQSVSALNMADFEPEKFINAFDEVDTNNSGNISLDELRIVLGQVYQDEPPENEVKFMMDLFDKNHDGIISRAEWVEAIPLLKEQKFTQTKNTTSEFKSAKAYRNAIKMGARLQ